MRKKRFQQFLAGLMATAMIISCVAIGPNDVRAASKTVTVSTQKELDAALKKLTGVKTISVKSDTLKKLAIKAGDYGKITLKVDAPNLKITNKGLFAKIQVKDASSITEGKSGNTYEVTDKKLTFTTNKNIKVKSLQYSSSDGVLTVKGTGSITNAKIVNAKTVSLGKTVVVGTVNVTSKKDVQIVADGTVKKVIVDSKANVTVTGVTTKAIEVQVNAEGAKVSTSVPTDIKLNANAEIEVKAGAEGTKVTATKENVTPTVKNESAESIKVTDSNANVVEVATGTSNTTENTEGGTGTGTGTEGTSGGSASEGNTSGGNTSGGNTSGGSTSEGNTSGGSVPIPASEEIYKGYTLKWQDEFNGTELNRDDWNVELHEAGWVNAELQEYVDSGDNIQVKDGKLYLIPKRTSKGVKIKNLLKNANFANEKTDWEEVIANWNDEVHADATGTVDATAGSITYDIKDVGDLDWHVQLKQGVELKKDKKYRVTFDIVSNVDRTIKAGVQTPEYAPLGDEQVPELKAGEKTSVTIEVDKVDTDVVGTLFFSMGKVSDTTPKDAKITISNIVFGELDVNNEMVKTEDFDYTSGRVNTQNKKTFTYGLFEVSAKVPEGAGYLPAFWLMSNDENIYGQWPRCGEIDCMEVMGQNTQKVYGTIHYGNPHGESQGTKVLTGDDSYSKNFHKFQCEWLPGTIRWYVDGVLYHEEKDWHSTTEGKGTLTYPAPFDQPFYVILNLAIGGSWVGYPDEKTSFDNNPFEVDYVRVYQKDSYSEAGLKRPEKPAATWREPIDGNYIYNGNFADDSNWTFLVPEDQGGAATMEIADNTINIYTTEEGKVDYAVQLVQPGIPLKKTAEYKVSFTAWADEARKTGVSVKAPDRGWIAYYNDDALELSTEQKEYSFTFVMNKESDPNGRLEFNMGAKGSVAGIHIKDVKFVKTKEEDPDADNQKQILADGNYIYNGSFQEGENHLGEWIISDGIEASVTDFADNRRLKAVVTKEGASISQEKLAFAGGKFEFGFEAEGKGSVNAVIAGVDTGKIALEDGRKTYPNKVTLPNTLANKDFKLIFNEPGTYYIDNIRFEDDALIKNGSFNAGTSSFEVYVDGSASASSTVDSLQEDNALDITINNTGDAEWKVQLKQGNVVLEEGQCYKLSFDIKSSIDRSFQYAIQRNGNTHDDDWTVYDKQPTVVLKAYVDQKDYTHIEEYFKMTKPTDTDSIFNIALGGGDITTQHRVCIDNILLEKIDESAMPEEEEPEVPNVSYDTELFEDTDFSAGKWALSSGTVADGVATYEISALTEGEEWDIELKQVDLAIEEGETYVLEFDITSSIERVVRAKIQQNGGDWALYWGGEDTGLITLPAGEKLHVEKKFKLAATDNAALFAIDMGKFADKNYGEHTIAISGVSLKKVREKAE